MSEVVNEAVEDDAEVFLRGVEQILKTLTLGTATDDIDTLVQTSSHPSLLERDGHQHRQSKGKLSIWTSIHYASMCLWRILALGYIYAMVRLIFAMYHRDLMLDASGF